MIMIIECSTFVHFFILAKYRTSNEKIANSIL